MAKKRKKIPDYGTVVQNGIEYYRTRIVDADGKRVALYGKTREELYDKVEEAKRMIEDASFRREKSNRKRVCREMAADAVGTCSRYDDDRLQIQGEELYH